MSGEIVGVIMGAIIGSMSSLSTTVLVSILKNRGRAKSIRAIAAAEITAIKEKCQRYIVGGSDREELSASSPMLTSIASCCILQNTAFDNDPLAESDRNAV